MRKEEISGKDRKDKKVISEAEAEAMVGRSLGTFLSSLESIGITFQVGSKDGDGVPYTQEKIDEIKNLVASSARKILEDNFTVERPSRQPGELTP
jgi:hypothetical protein